MNTSNTSNSTEGLPATTSNACGHAAADTAAPSPSTVHAPSSSNTNTNYNNPPTANVKIQDVKVKPTAVESPPANKNEGEVGDVSETLASLPQPILPKPPRPFNVAKFDEGEDAKLKNEAKQAIAAASSNLSEVAPSLPEPQPYHLEPPRPFNLADYDVDEDAKLKNEAKQAIAAASSNLSEVAASLPQPQPYHLEPPRPFNLADYDVDEDAKLKNEAKQAMAAASSNLSEVAASLPQPQPYHLEPPGPFNVADYDEGEDAKLKNETKQDAAATSSFPQPRPNRLGPPRPFNAILQPDDEESICVPTNEEIEGKPEAVTQDATVIRSGGNGELTSHLMVDEGGTEDVENGDYNIMDRESSVPVIPQAFLVEESDVVVATPTIPWWKQRRTKFLLCSVFVVVTILSVALGVSFSSSRTEFVAFTSSPSMSAGPTLHPTTGRPSLIPSSSPSSSQVPSSSPLSCSDTVVTNMQKFNLLRPDLDSPKVAIDGRNMVVVSTLFDEVEGTKYDKGSLYIEFYYLNDEDEWEQVLYTIEADFEWEWNLYNYDVSVSGETAAVGLPAKGVVYVYQRDIDGYWAQIDVLEPTTRIDQDGYSIGGPCGFGQSVQLDDDILVVVDSFECFGADCVITEPNAVNIFKRNVNKWEEIDVLTDDDVFFVDSSVKGGVIAVAGQDDISCADGYSIDLYQHAKHNNIITLMQRIETRRVDGLINSLDFLNDHHLILSLTNKISIFYRADPKQDFSYKQHLNTSDYEDGFGRAITMQKDILAIGGGSVTHFFAEQDDGMFEETLMIDEQYDNFELSGRTLVATKDTEVYILDIEGCTQAVPTQAPTLSIAPTSCFVVDLTFNSNYEWEAIFEKIESTGAVTVKSYSNVRIREDGSYSLPDQYEDSLCLAEGRYQFSITGVGNRKQPEKLLSAHYSVQSEGRVIAQGGSDQYEEMENPFPIEVRRSIEFDLPFDLLAATSPSSPTYYPTTPFPTQPLPTSSPESAGPTTPYPSWSPSQTPTVNPTGSPYIPEQTRQPTPNPTDYPDYTKSSTPSSATCAPLCPDGSECKYKDGGVDWDWLNECDESGFINVMRERDPEDEASFDKASEDACWDALNDMVALGYDFQISEDFAASNMEMDSPAGCYIRCYDGTWHGRFNPNAWNSISNPNIGDREPLCVSAEVEGT